jgi:hypothetical protein
VEPPDGGSSPVTEGNMLYRTAQSHRRARKFAVGPRTVDHRRAPALNSGTPLLDGDHLYTSDGLRLY